MKSFAEKDGDKKIFIFFSKQNSNKTLFQHTERERERDNIRHFILRWYDKISKKQFLTVCSNHNNNN